MSDCPSAIAEPFILHIGDPDCLTPANEFSLLAEIIGLVQAPKVELVGSNAGSSIVEIHTELQLSQGGFPVENTDVYAELRMAEDIFEDGVTSRLPCGGTQWAIGLRNATGDLTECYLMATSWSSIEALPAGYESCLSWE